MAVGFPYKSTFSQKSGFRYPTATFNKATNVGRQTFIYSNTSSREGGSGSGIFILDNDNGNPKAILGAIHVAEGGVGLQTAAILENLKASNMSIYNDLASAIQTKNCD